MTKDELIELAQVGMGIHSPNQPEYIVCEALIKALAQPEPWEKFCDSNCVWTDHHPDCKLAERKPLTDEQVWACLPKDPDEMAFARAIEAAHGITGDNK
jgi:hypothetical protein